MLCLDTMASGKVGRRDAHLEALRGMWTEMKALNGRVDRTNEALDALRSEVHGLGDRVESVEHNVDALGRRIVESEVRLATVTTQLSSDVQSLSCLIREWREEHRQDRAEVKVRLLRLEQHAGLAPR